MDVQHIVTVCKMIIVTLEHFNDCVNSCRFSNFMSMGFYISALKHACIVFYMSSYIFNHEKQYVTMTFKVRGLHGNKKQV